MFLGDLRHFFSPFLFPHAPTHFLPSVSFLIRFSGSFEWCSSMCGLHRLNGCVIVKGMAFRIGLLATRLPISECFRGASIGFVGHKTAGSAGESRTIRQANYWHEARQVRKGGKREKEKKWDGKKPNSRTVCPLLRTKNRSTTRDCRNF